MVGRTNFTGEEQITNVKNVHCLQNCLLMLPIAIFTVHRYQAENGIAELPS